MEIITLKEHHMEAAAHVLTQSFFDYPVMQYFLGDSALAYADQLGTMMRVFCDHQLLLGWPMLGIHKDQKLVAVAMVEPPQAIFSEEQERNFNQAIVHSNGQEALDRLKYYETHTNPLRPGKTHHYLDTLGVLPEYQKQGLAAQLLAAVQNISEAHPASTGVCLHTEKPENVTFYQHRGFQTLAEKILPEFTSWCLFKPNEGQKG